MYTTIGLISQSVVGLPCPVHKLQCNHATEESIQYHIAKYTSSLIVQCVSIYSIKEQTMQRSHKFFLFFLDLEMQSSCKFFLFFLDLEMQSSCKFFCFFLI